MGFAVNFVIAILAYHAGTRGRREQFSQESEMFKRRIDAEREQERERRRIDAVRVQYTSKLEAYVAVLQADDKFGVEIMMSSANERVVQIHANWVEPLRRAQLFAPKPLDDLLEKMRDSQAALSDGRLKRSPALEGLQKQHLVTRLMVLEAMRIDLDVEAKELGVQGKVISKVAVLDAVRTRVKNSTMETPTVSPTVTT